MHMLRVVALSRCALRAARTQTLSALSAPRARFVCSHGLAADTQDWLAPRCAPARWYSATTPVKKQPVVLREEDLEESFVKGSGKGGQKINKVRNCVLLKHKPTGLLVRCQKTRSLDDNRRVARKLLLQKLDDAINGALSTRSLKIDKLRRRKANKRAKTKQKYGAASKDGEAEDSDSDDRDSASDDEDDDDEDDEDEDAESDEEDNRRPTEPRAPRD